MVPHLASCIPGDKEVLPIPASPDFSPSLTSPVLTQYKKTVRPMHHLFVEPSKAHANVIVPVGHNSVAVDLILSRLRFAISNTTPRLS